MKEEEVESLLKEALIKKYGDKCHFCGKSDVPLMIDHILGQKELERQYFDKFVRFSDFVTDYDRLMYCYYYHNFNEESKFIGLVCKKCEVIQKEIPRIEDILFLLSNSLNENCSNELKLLVSKYPQTIPILDRVTRSTLQILLEEYQSRQHNHGNNNHHDNLGEAFGI